MKLLVTSFIFFVIASGVVSQACAVSIPLQLYTDSQVYSEGQPLLAYGKTSSGNQTVILRLLAPDGTYKQFDQIMSDSHGNFDQILIRWPNATTNYPYGTYSVEGILPKGQGYSQTVDIKFAPSSTLSPVPIQRNVVVSVNAPQTATLNQTFRVFIQVTNDGLLVPEDPSKLLANSYVHEPDGNTVILTNSFSTLNPGLYYLDFTPKEEGTYIFVIIAFNQGAEGNGSVATLVQKQSIEGISNQLIQLNSALETTSGELDKMKNEVQNFGQVLNTSQTTMSHANISMNNTVTSMSQSVQNLESASGQINSLFLPVVALIAVIIALQITIIARRR